MKTIKIKLALSEGAFMPEKGSKMARGYDVRACSMQRQGNIVTYDTGISVTPQNGYCVDICPNSRSAKRGYIYGNGYGIIDPDYTGTIKVILTLLPHCKEEDVPQVGDVIGQLLIKEHLQADFELVESLENTERGQGGFGSTEKKL